MISVIIPIAGSNHKQNLNTLLHFLKRQTYKKFETILVEQVCNPEAVLFDKAPVDKYISVYDPVNKYVNINWQKNVGAKLAFGRVYLFLDADIVFEDTYLEEVIRYVKQKAWFVAWKYLFYCSQEESDLIRQSGSVCIIPKKQPEYPAPANAMGGSVCMTKSFYLNKLHGLNESYCGWGGDDNDTGCRATKADGALNILSDQKIYHLEHEMVNKEFPQHIAKIQTKNISRQWNLTELYPIRVTSLLSVNNIGQLDGPFIIDADKMFEKIRIEKIIADLYVDVEKAKHKINMWYSEIDSINKQIASRQEELKKLL